MMKVRDSHSLWTTLWEPPPEYELGGGGGKQVYETPDLAYRRSWRRRVPSFVPSFHLSFQEQITSQIWGRGQGEGGVSTKSPYFSGLLWAWKGSECFSMPSGRWMLVRIEQRGMNVPGGPAGDSKAGTGRKVEGEHPRESTALGNTRTGRKAKKTFEARE